LLLSQTRRSVDSVGSDILLARHGNAITSMRLDRHNGRVIALLDDGRLDSAPNMIDPAMAHQAEADRIAAEDRKNVAWICIYGFGCLIALSALVGAIIGNFDNAALTDLATMLNSYPTTGS
jgi:hypothetical protein